MSEACRRPKARDYMLPLLQSHLMVCKSSTSRTTDLESGFLEQKALTVTSGSRSCTTGSRCSVRSVVPSLRIANLRFCAPSEKRP